jgi:2-oxoglutarate dehydrogenase E1 component
VQTGFERPLIVMTPKSLLRLPAAGSSLEQLTSGGFEPLINDAQVEDPNSVERIVFCSGKVFYDLAEARKKAVSEPGAGATGSGDTVALIRIEQFYPFPRTALTETIARYPKATDLVWCQEEPKNMGGWTFMEGKFEDLIPGGDRLRYVGRAESPSPATGNYAVHVREQERLIREALVID